MTLRQEKLNTLFKKLIARFFGAYGADALITITNCRVSRDAKNAKVLIAVYPENKTNSVMSLIQKEQKELGEFLKQHTRMKFIPHFIFLTDTGESKRQKISELLDKK